MNDELYHYGRKGMKWYQNIFTSGKERKARKRRLKNLEKARQARTDKKVLEDEKKKAMETGSASDVLKFKGKYTAAEMQYISTRLNWERNMKDLQSKEISYGKSKADSVMDKVGKITDNVNTGAKAYNTFANIYNAFSKKEVPLPKIDTNITSGNKQERMGIIEKVKNKTEKKAREKELENTSASDALKNWNKYSTDDRQSLVKNLNMKKTIQSLAKDETPISNVSSNDVNSGKEAVDNILDDKK